MKKVRIVKNNIELCNFDINTETPKLDIIIEEEIGDDIKKIYKFGGIDISDNILILKLCSDYWTEEYKNMK